MDHPTNEQFEELKKRVERLEQQTEPIKVTRIEIDTGDVRERFDRIERKQADHSERFDILDRRQQEAKEELKQEFYTISHTWLEALQENVNEIKTEILTAQGTQNERFDRIETTMATKADMAVMETRLDRIETTMATKADMAVMETRMDRIETTMATKADMAVMETRMDRIESAQAEQGAKLDQILALLQQNRSDK